MVLAVGGPWVQGAFVDVTDSSGIVDFERIDRLGVPDFLERGGSIVVMDFDRNGWQDLYITRYGQEDILFANFEGAFQRIDNPLGLDTNNGGNASVWADFDNDGDPDMMVAVVDEKRHLMYLNNGDGTFSESGLERGIALTSSLDHQGSSIAAGDINRDGYLDVVIGEWGADVTEQNRFEHYGLFLNRGDEAPGYFTNITESAGYLFSPPSINFYTPCITDLDGDGWPDLATVVDFGDSAIFWNNADGTFQNTTEASQVGVERHGMGSAIGDINQDGMLDWFVTTIAMTFSPIEGEANQVYLKQGEILQVEYGPSKDMTIQCATYYDAADLTGIARLFCGVHIAADDFVGREVGARAGIDAFLKVNALRGAPAILDTPRLRYPLESTQATPLIEIESTLERLPVHIVADSKLATSTSNPGIYFVHPQNATSSSVELIAKGGSVEGLTLKGTVRSDTPFELVFDISSDSNVYLWASAKLASEDDSASLRRNRAR